MSSSYLQGLNAYANSAGEINENFGRYREDVDNIKAANKGLVQAAQSRMDLDDLQGIGEEMAVRAFKKYGGKALGWVDKKAFGGKIGEDTDAFNDMVSKKFEDLKGRIGNKFNNVRERMRQRGGEDEGNEGGEGVDEGGDANFEGGDGSDLMLEDGNEVEPDFQVLPNEEDERDMMGGEDQDAPEQVQPEEDLGDDAEPEMSFDDFMEQFDNVPRTETGDIDFERVDNQMGMLQEDARSRRMNQQPEEKQDVGEETKEGEDEDEPEGEGDDAADEGADDLGDLGGEGGDTALTTLGSGAAEEGAEEGLSAGLEGAGTALDATGYGAIIGVPLQIAGAVLEGGAIYQAGKSIVDWFERDVLGEKPKIKTNPIPAAPITLAEKGLMLTPSMDTLDTQPSYAGGW